MDKEGGYASLLDLFPEKDETLPNTFINGVQVFFIRSKLGVFNQNPFHNVSIYSVNVKTMRKINHTFVAFSENLSNRLTPPPP